MKINILGSKWTIIERAKEDDSLLEKCDGYCDKTVRKIVIIKCPEEADIENWDQYKRKITRHEIIHAFLFESGLHENFTHSEYGHDETTVDWFAVQFPKLLTAFGEAGCIED